MATLSLTIVPGKALRDGKHKVRIAVAHNSQTRYIVTDVVLNSSKEWKNGKIVKRDDATYLNIKLLQRMQEAQRIIDEAPYIEGMSCAELVEQIQNARKKKSHTIASATEEMLEVSTAKESSKTAYRYLYSSIVQALPASTLVKNITPLMVRRFVKQRSTQVSAVTLQNQLAFLSMLLKFCYDNGYVEYRTSPVAGIMKSVAAVRQNWLSPDEVRNIRDAETKGGETRFRDMFMLSYYLGGVNMIDLARINFNECADTLHYVRSKTERKAKVNPYVEFDIPDEAKPIITKYKGDDGYINLYQGLPAEQWSQRVGHHIEGMRARLGQPALTFYSARKSFAQHAFMLGENESVIDYILGHSLGAGKSTMLYSYIKVTPEMATACVRKVCDFIASSRNF